MLPTSLVVVLIIIYVISIMPRRLPVSSIEQLHITWLFSDCFFFNCCIAVNVNIQLYNVVYGNFHSNDGNEGKN